MEKWAIHYYEGINGECPVREFIDSRDQRNQAKIMAFLGLLEERGPNLPRPYADLLEDGIHELRVKLSGEQIRILYFFIFKNQIILTHAFQKNTARVPSKELRLAKQMRKDYIRRFSA